MNNSKKIKQKRQDFLKGVGVGVALSTALALFKSYKSSAEQIRKFNETIEYIELVAQAIVENMANRRYGRYEEENKE